MTKVKAIYQIFVDLIFSVNFLGFILTHFIYTSFFEVISQRFFDTFSFHEFSFQIHNKLFLTPSHFTTFFLRSQFSIHNLLFLDLWVLWVLLLDIGDAILENENFLEMQSAKAKSVRRRPAALSHCLTASVITDIKL